MAAYQISSQQSAGEEVRRIARDRIEQAIAAIEQGSAEGVHDARKRLKELRALLRLVRKPLGKPAFAEHNGILRDVGHRLSERRDATAIVECWEALAKQDPQRFASAPLQRVHARLVSRAEGEQPGTHQSLTTSLRDELERIPDWDLPKAGFSLFRAGVLRTYRDGRKALKAAQKDPSDERLHQWRKRVKDHWYQTRLLQEAWPRLFKARQKTLKTLSDHLGDDHDLAMLQTLMREQPELFGAPQTHEAVAALASARREQLQQRAWRLGRRLYAERPDALVRLWGRYWRIARKGVQGSAR